MSDIVLLLREARRRSGLSQREAAAKSGVGEKSISSFETGARGSSLKLSQLEALLGAYGTTIERVFSRDYLEDLPEDPRQKVVRELVAWMGQLSRKELDVCAKLLQLLVETMNASR